MNALPCMSEPALLIALLVTLAVGILAGYLFGRWDPIGPIGYDDPPKPKARRP